MNSFRSVSTKYQICSVPFRSVPFILNSFRSVSTKYWLCSVSICSVPFRLNSFLSDSTKYRFYSVSFSIQFRSVPFLFVSFHFAKYLSPFFPFHSVPINRNKFLSIGCFLNVLNFPLGVIRRLRHTKIQDFDPPPVFFVSRENFFVTREKNRFCTRENWIQPMTKSMKQPVRHIFFPWKAQQNATREIQTLRRANLKTRPFAIRSAFVK